MHSVCCPKEFVNLAASLQPIFYSKSDQKQQQVTMNISSSPSFTSSGEKVENVNTY